MEAFEYAIRKDVRNNPIVREVDAAREREQWKWFGIAVLVLIVVLTLAWQHLELRWHGYDVDALRKQLAAEDNTRRHLLLELEGLRAPQRIEEIAMRRLRMVQPSPEDSIVIERVRPGEPPADTMVAQR
jgi:cell division protein FtsL